MGSHAVSKQFGKITVPNIGKYTIIDTGVGKRLPIYENVY